MKSLYTVRWNDGQLMKFNGAAWSVVSGAVLSDWPTDSVEDRANRSVGLFAFRGKLYIRYRTSQSTSRKTRVMEFTGSALSLVAENNGDSGQYERWGNAFEYAGKIHWFASTIPDGGDDLRSYLIIYTVSSDGTTISLGRRVAYEMGGSTHNGALNFNSSSVNATGPKVIPFRDRMMIAPPGGNSNVGGTNTIWDYTHSIDVDSNSNVNNIPLLDWDDTTRFDYAQNGQEYPRVPNRLLNHYITACPWKTKLYAVSLSGILYSIDTSNGQKTEIADLSQTSIFELQGGATYVTNQTTPLYEPSSTLSFTDGYNNAGFNWPWRSQLMTGATVKILNYNGISNNPRRGWIDSAFEHYGSVDLRIVDENGTPLSQQPSGTQFKVYHNPDTNKSNNNGWGCETIAHSFVWSGKLYIMFLNSKRLQDATGDPTNVYPKWGLVAYDGVNPPTVYSYLNSSSPYNVSAAAIEIDETVGHLHVLYQDPVGGNVRHEDFDLSNGTKLTRGSVYTRASNDDVDKYAGIVLDSLIAFDTGDVIPHIVSRTVDVVAKKVTIQYKLYGTNSDSSTVSIQFNIGSGQATDWTNCSRKGTEGEDTGSVSSSPSGATHTFVHDINADLGANFIGTIQHRIGITSQTRN